MVIIKQKPVVDTQKIKNLMEHDNVRKRMYVCMCDWVNMLYSRKLTEHGKSAIMEKNKNHLKKSKHTNAKIIISQCKRASTEKWNRGTTKHQGDKEQSQ